MEVYNKTKFLNFFILIEVYSADIVLIGIKNLRSF